MATRQRSSVSERSPDAVEIIVPLIIWSALFEIVIPLERSWHVPTIADPKDVLSYCLGAMVAAGFWKWRYGGEVKVTHGTARP